MASPIGLRPVPAETARAQVANPIDLISVADPASATGRVLVANPIDLTSVADPVSATGRELVADPTGPT
jgi:hypothetical protein